MKNLSIMAKACDKNRPRCSAIFYNASKNECIATDGHVALIQKEGFPFQSQTDIAIDPTTLTSIDPAFAPTPPDYERIEFNPGDPDVTALDISYGDLYERTTRNRNIAKEVVCVGGTYFNKKYIKLIAEFFGYMPTIAYKRGNVFRFDNEDGKRRAYLMPISSISADDYKRAKQDVSLNSLCKAKPPVIVFAVQTPGAPDAPVRAFKDKKQADDVAKSLNVEVVPVLVED